MIESLSKYLKVAKENYFKHLSRALNFAASLVVTSFLAFVHMLLAAIFLRTARKKVKSFMGIR